MSNIDKSVSKIKVSNMKKVRFSGCKVHYFEEYHSPAAPKFDRNKNTPTLRVEKLESNESMKDTK